MLDEANKWLGIEGAVPCPLWQRGNAFLGGKNVGSAMHQDKIMWSNVGKNHLGYKLFIMWPLESSLEVMDLCSEDILAPPFTEHHIAILRKACKVVVVGPGDVYVFSGAGPHMAMGLGSGLSLAAYEAVLNFHPENLQMFLKSNTQLHHYDCRSSNNDVYDWMEDIIYNLASLHHRCCDSQAALPRGTETLNCISATLEEMCSSDDDFLDELEAVLKKQKTRKKKNFSTAYLQLLEQCVARSSRGSSKRAKTVHSKRDPISISCAQPHSPGEVAGIVDQM